MAWVAGDSVLWRSRLSDGIGFVYAGNLIAETDEWIAIYQPTGAPGKTRVGSRGGPRGRNMLPGGWSGHHEDSTFTGPGTTRLHPTGTHFSVLRRWDPANGTYRGWYVNLERDWRPTPVGFDSRDDVLDVVVDDDLSTWSLKDEDELAWSVDVGKLSADEADSIRRTAQEVGTRIEGRAFPFREDAWTSLSPDPGWPLPEICEEWANPFGTADGAP